MKSALRSSVQGRLMLLVGVHIATIALLLAIGLVALSRISHDTRFMYRYMLVPVASIGVGLDRAAELESRAAPTNEDVLRLTGEIRGFTARYVQEWKVDGGTSEDALSFQSDLVRAGRRDLLARETSAVAEIERALTRWEAHQPGVGGGPAHVGLRAGLAELLDVNLRFAEIAEAAVERRANRMLVTMGTVSAIGALAAVLLMMRVRRTLARRIGQLVQKVREFQEQGVYESVAEEHDEIATLGKALDCGFEGIMARQRSIAVLAHDLRNPLASIRAGASNLIAHGDMAEPRVHVVRRIATSSERMAVMVDSLMDAARVWRLGGLPIEPRPTDLHALGRQVIGEVQASYPGRRVELTLRGSGEGVWDAGRISEMISNLVCNALDHGPEMASVLVTIRPLESQDERGDAVVLEVHNEGHIPPDKRATLFDPFSSAMRSHRKPSSKGLGLGLFIAKCVVSAHHGSLDVESDPTHGTTFRVTLPRTPPPTR